MQKWEYKDIITSGTLVTSKHPDTGEMMYHLVGYEDGVEVEFPTGKMGSSDRKSRRKTIREYLRHLGEQGWELVHVKSVDGGYNNEMYLFKRPLPD